MKKALLFFLFPLFVHAAEQKKIEVIEFPEEELATESVLPIFDQPVSTKNRTVTLGGRFELGAFMGWSLAEPFFNPMNFGGTIGYFFNEVQGVTIFANRWASGGSQTYDQLLAQGVALNNAPSAESLILANYQYNAYYGKFSMSKQKVTNLSLYGELGAGAELIGGEALPTLAFGLGQKFYFNPNFGLKVDLMGYLNNAPNVVSKNLAGLSKQPGSYFDHQLTFNLIITAGLVYLFPSM